MAETYCVRHFDQIATGHCSTCNKPYCAECLSMEADQLICANCREMKIKAAAAEALKASTDPLAGGSPLNFKGKGLSDDPLGLFSGTPKSEAPKVKPSAEVLVPPTPIPLPIPPPLLVPKSIVTNTPLKTDLQTPPPLTAPDLLSPIKQGTPTPSLVSPPASQSKLSENLNAMMHDPQPLRPPFPKASMPVDETEGNEGRKPAWKNIRVFSLAKIWGKYLIRRSYEMFDPLAKKFKVPVYVLPIAVVILIIGAVIGLGSLLGKPSVILAETIQPIFIVQENSNQVSEMDITAYAEFQTSLQNMGFTPLIQMTVPQLPSPNFFDVGMKGDSGIYSEILKMPGQIAPHLSFVTVFSNGVWFSTNAWQGDNQTMDYLISEYYPDDTSDQLYTQHVQTLEKLKQDNGWQVQTMGENRYLAALSDHLRWFLNKKDLQGYQADFKLWH